LTWNGEKIKKVNINTYGKEFWGKKAPEDAQKKKT